MTEHHDATHGKTPRERELELEVARLQAELDTLRGEDAVTAASRFLAMAAATVDLAVADARREADEIVEEVSAQAEARRDEATRVAAEAEALAERKLVEADQSQETIDAAKEEAASIRSAAETEASELIAQERSRLADEISALADVRGVLEDERGVLESYHDELRRRVHELAASMVSFMTTQPPLGSSLEVESMLPPQLAAVLAEIPDPSVVDDAVDTLDESEQEEAAALFEAAILASTRIVDVPEELVDEITEGPMMRFGGVPVVEEPGEDETVAEKPRSASAGLFARAREFETGFEDLADDEDEEDDASDASLFGTIGARLIEQTSPTDLADALEADAVDDEAFRQFLDGDDAPDASRDWLLKPDQS